MKVKKDLEDFVVKFAGEIISFYKAMIFCEREFIVSKRLLKSGTGIGSNFACRQFNNAYEKAVETEFWLKIAKSLGYRKILGIDGVEKNIDCLIFKSRQLVELLGEKSKIM